MMLKPAKADAPVLELCRETRDKSYDTLQMCTKYGEMESLETKAVTKAGAFAFSCVA
ncbi:MAG: hypothetical protein LZF61_10630 [Nitrosomonas sp.]|nr:MAG: hypothetical protein LZF61_10630 [Nitrosomonas sp.]